MSIPQFPEFAKLNLSHKEVLQEIANSFPAYSDFNFVSLFSWDTGGVAKVSYLNKNLVIQFSDYKDESKFYSLLGENGIDETMHDILIHAKENGEKAELLLVPHSTASRASKERFEINEDHDNHDYILSVNDLVEFRTNKYRGKKNLYNRFVRNYGDRAESKELDIKNPVVRSDILELVDTWQRSRDKDIDDTKNEIAAIRRCLQNAEDLEVQAYGTYISDTLVAFNIFEILPNKVALLHFDKANTDYIGVFEHLKHNFAKHLAAMDIETINFEQDLGIEGMRRNKQSLHPISYLKKYKIRLKTT